MATAKEPYVTIRKAVAGLRALAMAFLLMGVGVGVITFRFTTSKTEGIALMLSVGIFLMVPGALYCLFARDVERRDLAAARVAACTALIHSLVPVAAIMVAVTNSQMRRDSLGLALVPPMACMFFAPALLAQALSLHRARQTIRELPEGQRGFEAVVGHRNDSDLGK